MLVLWLLVLLLWWVFVFVVLRMLFDCVNSVGLADSFRVVFGCLISLLVKFMICCFLWWIDVVLWLLVLLWCCVWVDCVWWFVLVMALVFEVLYIAALLVPSLGFVGLGLGWFCGWFYECLLNAVVVLLLLELFCCVICGRWLFCACCCSGARILRC